MGNFITKIIINIETRKSLMIIFHNEKIFDNLKSGHIPHVEVLKTNMCN